MATFLRAPGSFDGERYLETLQSECLKGLPTHFLSSLCSFIDPPHPPETWKAPARPPLIPFNERLLPTGHRAQGSLESKLPAAGPAPVSHRIFTWTQSTAKQRAGPPRRSARAHLSVSIKAEPGGRPSVSGRRAVPAASSQKCTVCPLHTAPAPSPLFASWVIPSCHLSSPAPHL